MTKTIKPKTPTADFWKGVDPEIAEFERGLLDWIRHQFATSSGWRVRPGERGHHFEMLGILGQ